MCKGSHLMALVPTMLVRPADTWRGSREAREKPVAPDEVVGTEAQAVRAEQGLQGAWSRGAWSAYARVCSCWVGLAGAVLLQRFEKKPRKRNFSTGHEARV